jgi:hypothetical protein
MCPVRLLIRHRYSLTLVAIAGLLSFSVLAACGIDSPAPAARPRATVESLRTPTVFAVIEVTPVPPELVAQFEGGGDYKPIPPALDTRFTILEPRIEVVQAAWRQYLAGTRITTDTSDIEWLLCSNGTGRFTDDGRFGDAGRWLVLNPPRSLDWHETLVGTYPPEAGTVLVVLSMFDGVPHVTITPWDQPPSRGGRPGGVEPMPIQVKVMVDDSGCAVR